MIPACLELSLAPPHVQKGCVTVRDRLRTYQAQPILIATSFLRGCGESVFIRWLGNPNGYEE